MKEDFLHFVWQHCLFDYQNIQGTAGESIELIDRGTANGNSGPDFLHAKINIDNVEWHGHVEIHLRSSDWRKHKHDRDKAYDNVVLHVVWTDDLPLYNNGERIPTIELKSRVKESIIFRYRNLLETKQSIACAAVLPEVSNITVISQLDKAGMQRLERKAKNVIRLLEARKGNWEETVYSLLFNNFGFKVNAEAFLTLSERLPLHIIRKEKHRLPETEALLFGMAGFLQSNAVDEYQAHLQRSYRFLAHKYQLSAHEMSLSQWRFLRLRPANFPTIRIAQIAMLIHQKDHLFSFFKESQKPQDLGNALKITASAYWDTHYQFGRISEKKPKKTGKQAIDNILINTLAPLLVAYGKHTDEQKYIDRAIDLLENVRAEKNRIITHWQQLNLAPKHAFDTQAMIEQYHEFCQSKRCLKCNIGVSLVRKERPAAI